MWLARWYIAKAAKLADLEPALDLLRWVSKHSLPSGILAEQVHPFTNQPLSVSPLTWSHAEVVATVGLLLVIFGSVRGGNGRATPFAVGAYIGGAYFFTSSTSFANPAVTIGRAFTDTFAGIEPADVAGFIAAQLVGAVIAYGLVRVLFPKFDGANTVVPHDAEVTP